MSSYHDRWITLTDSEVVIRAYYFPWGTKRISYSAIRSVSRVRLSIMRGRGRIWGSGDPTLSVWASLDPGRPRKREGFLIDCGRHTKPLITPEGPDAAEAVLREHLAPGVLATGTSRGPIV